MNIFQTAALSIMFFSAIALNAMDIKYIVLPEQPTPWEMKAVEEFKTYMKKISGIEVPVYKYNSEYPIAKGLYIGNAAVKKGLFTDADNEKLSHDGYSLNVKNGNAGIYGPFSAGVLFGVYGLLEEGGVKIYGKDCEVLPGKFAISDELQKTVNPAFESRHLSASFFNWSRYYAGFPAARLGFNAQFNQEKLGVNLSGDWLDSKVPSCEIGHTTRYMVPTYKYWKSNPEYFAHDKDGRLITSDPNHAHLCLSNPEVRKISKERVRSWAKDFPYSRFIWVVQEDLGNWCQCPDCLALDPFPGKKQNDRYNNLSDRTASFLNPIATELKEKYPDKIVIFAAYRETVELPLREKLDSPNIRVIFCSTPCSGVPCKSHTLECPRNKSGYELYKQWLKAVPGRVYVWEYCMNFINRYSPYFPMDAMNWKLKKYHNDGVKGIVYNGAPRMFIQLFCYVQGKLLWNPEADPTKLEDEFLANFYGPAAPEMKEFLSLLRALINSNKKPVHQQEYASIDPLITPEYISKAEEIFSRAEEKVKNDPVYLKRVRYEKLSAVLLPALDTGYQPDYLKKLDMLRQIINISEDWSLVKIKGGKNDAAKWIESKFGFKVKLSTDNWKSDPLLKKLSDCRNLEELKKLEDKIKVLEKMPETYELTANGNIKLLLDGFSMKSGKAMPMLYDYQCKPQTAIPLFPNDAYKTNFPLPEKRGNIILVLTALDQDKAPVTKIRILVNNHEIFNGANKASKTEWTRLSFKIPSEYLGPENTLEIINLETNNEPGYNWLCIAGAEVEVE